LQLKKYLFVISPLKISKKRDFETLIERLLLFYLVVPVFFFFTAREIKVAPTIIMIKPPTPIDNQAQTGKPNQVC